MPLTLERDGVFRASVYDKTDWYIVDPSVEGGVDVAREEFFRRVGPTNRGEWDRVARATVFLVVAVLVGGGISYLSNLIPGIDIWRGLIYVVAFIVGAIAAGLATIPVFPLPRLDPLDRHVVWPIPPHIAEWAGDTIPQSDIWGLVQAHHRLDELRRLASVMLDVWDFEHEQPRPNEVLDVWMEPLIVGEFSARRTNYLRIAEEVGFTPRADDVIDLPDFAELRKR